MSRAKPRKAHFASRTMAWAQESRTRPDALIARVGFQAALKSLRVKRKERSLRPGEAEKWIRDYFCNLGLHRLRGTVRYPETVNYHAPESPPVSRVREIRTHGLNGGLVNPRREARRFRRGRVGFRGTAARADAI